MFIALAVLVGFQCYLVVNNLTTWEFLKWEQIEYLAIFDRTKLNSPFSKGIKQNIKSLWQMTKEPEQKKWI
jgi:hypothetical protein